MIFYGINIYYFIFMIPAFIITIWASVKMRSTFAKYEKVPTIGGLTGAQAARRILDGNGLTGVPVERVEGTLSDHYDPEKNVVRLSDATFSSASIGAVGVAAHECGHAVQHAVNYGPMRLRTGLVPVTNLASTLAIPLIFIGFLFSASGLSFLVYVGIALFSLAVVFQLVTLPVEMNASRRAIETLNSTNMVTPEESEGVRKVLFAAALTYVAALLSSLLQLLYFLVLAGGRRGRR